MTFSRRWKKIRQTQKNISLARTPSFISACWNRFALGQSLVSFDHYKTHKTRISANSVEAFTFPENPPRGKILGNFMVPKDTTVIVDAFAINIRNPFWGPDNRSYRPSRFAGIKQNQVRISSCPKEMTGKLI